MRQEKEKVTICQWRKKRWDKIWMKRWRVTKEVGMKVTLSMSMKATGMSTGDPMMMSL